MSEQLEHKSHEARKVTGIPYTEHCAISHCCSHASKL